MITNQSSFTQKVSLDLSKMLIVDEANNLQKVDLETARDNGMKAIYLPLNGAMQFSDDTAYKVTDVLVSKSGDDVTSSAATPKIVVGIGKTTGQTRNKSIPELDAANQKSLAELTLDATTLTAINTAPLNKDDITGSLADNLDYSDITDAGIVIYVSAPAADLTATLTGIINISLEYMAFAN